MINILDAIWSSFLLRFTGIQLTQQTSFKKKRNATPGGEYLRSSNSCLKINFFISNFKIWVLKYSRNWIFCLFFWGSKYYVNENPTHIHVFGKIYEQFVRKNEQKYSLFIHSNYNNLIFSSFLIQLLNMSTHG